jgi:uncharacterized protein YlaI
VVLLVGIFFLVVVMGDHVGGYVITVACCRMLMAVVFMMAMLSNATIKFQKVRNKPLSNLVICADCHSSIRPTFKTHFKEGAPVS